MTSEQENPVTQPNDTEQLQQRESNEKEKDTTPKSDTKEDIEKQDTVNGSSHPTTESNAEEQTENISTSNQPNNNDGDSKESHPSIVLSVTVPQTKDDTQDSTDQSGGQKSDLVHEPNRTDTNDSNGDLNPDSRTPLDENDMDEYDPDLYITDEERKAFEYMLDQRREEIVKQRENFKNWVDSITRRRMFALSRLRKINKCHKERMQFYEKIDDYIKTADNVIKSNVSSPRHDDSSLQSFSKGANNQKFEDMVRENTGFVINSKNESDESNDNESLKSENNEEVLKSNKKLEKEHESNPTTESENLNNNNSNVYNAESNGNVDDDAKHNISNKSDNTPKIVPVQS